MCSKDLKTFGRADRVLTIRIATRNRSRVGARDFTHKPNRKFMALCFECMELPRMQPKDFDGEFVNDPQQAVKAASQKHQRRLRGARAAKGGY